MILTGRVWKDGKFWLIECADLDAMTQGHTKSEAFEMLADWILTMTEDPDLEVQILPGPGEEFAIRFSDPKAIVGLMIQQARQASGITLEELASKLGVKGKSSARHFETGKHGLTVAKAHQVFNALGFELEFSLRKVVKTPAAAHGPAKKAAKRA